MPSSLTEIGEDAFWSTGISEVILPDGLKTVGKKAFQYCNDLTKMGSFLFMALIGLIITTIVNIFVGSSTLEWLISFAGVAIFIGLTAWDTQKIKQMVQYSDSSQVGKIATIGALTLYLDFINLFLYMLRFFGNSRN